MKLYDCTTAPSPRRARMFIAEKGLEIELIQVDLANKEQLTPEFRQINPRCTVPVLELDDGSVITENAGIARYLEELYPEPVLLGSDPFEMAIVASWNARIEFEGIFAIAESIRNDFEGFKQRSITGPVNFDQIPQLVERGRARAIEFLDMFDTHLADKEFVCGDNFTMADITAFVAVDLATWIKLSIGEDQHNLQRWFDAMSARPSAQA
jgi:glutathione S-transferase